MTPLTDAYCLCADADAAPATSAPAPAAPSLQRTHHSRPPVRRLDTTAGRHLPTLLCEGRNNYYG
jgi:hypothetical protein